MKHRRLSLITLAGSALAVLAWSASPASAQIKGWDSLWYGGPGGYGNTWIGWGWTPPYVYYGYGSPYHPTGSTTSSGVNVDLRTAFYSAPVDAGSGAVINVHVPPHARVYFEGSPTQSPGPFRRFASPPLDASRTYTYEIRAAWTQDGGTVERTRKVAVHRGEPVNVDFLVKSEAERGMKSSDEYRPPKPDLRDENKSPSPPPPAPKPQNPDEKPPHAF